jgi:bla regulator protein blaR1
MNTSVLFFAISQAMLLSLAQGLLIFMVLKLILKAAPGISAIGRYRLFYSSLVLVFISFLIYVFKLYEANEISSGYKGAISSFINTQSESSGLSFQTWLQLNSTWIAGFYFLGVISQTILLISGLIKIKQIRNQQKTVLNFVWDIRLGKLCSRLEINKEVRLYFSDKILIPLTAGYIKPIILFPVAMISRLSIEQVEAILLHELAHIKRNDYALNILQRQIEIILFFNPMVWIMSREIKKEREFCCDDLVVEYSNNPGIYASALALLEENKTNNLRLVLAANGSSKYPLLNRIKRITTMKTLKNNPKQQLLAIISILAIGLSLAWAIPSDTTKVKKNDRKDSLLLPRAPLPPVAPIAPLDPISNVDPIAPLPPLSPLSKKSRKLSAPLPPLAPQAPEAPLFLVPPPPPPADTNDIKKYFNSPEWKKKQEEMKKMAEEMKKQFDSPEWKKQIQEMKIAGEEMKKQFNSPEWKKQMQQMKVDAEKMKAQFESPQWKKQMEQMKIDSEKMKKQFDSPEWKKQMEQMKIETEKMQKQFDSPEWKKQMEQMKIETEKMQKQFDSPEWKKQMEQMKMEAEKIGKQADISERKN